MDSKEFPWKKLDVDIVLESSGQFRRSSQKDNDFFGSYDDHLFAGAKRAVLTTMPLDETDYSIVVGANDKDIGPKTKVIYNPSSTVNCMVPIMKLLNEKLGVVSGFLTSVHAMTNEQKNAWFSISRSCSLCCRKYHSNETLWYKVPFKCCSWPDKRDWRRFNQCTCF